MINRELLASLANKGEMNAQEFLGPIQRLHGDYIDYYPAAALLHAGYVTTNTLRTGEPQDTSPMLGETTQKTAAFLHQLMLNKGETFRFNDCIRESAIDFPIQFIMTADGYLKLEELEEKDETKRQKKTDYCVSLGIALITGIVIAILIFSIVSLFRYSEITLILLPKKFLFHHPSQDPSHAPQKMRRVA